MRDAAESLRPHAPLSPGDWLARGAGAAATALGGVVLLGWYAGISTLIQVRPDLVPMQHNTALGFVLCGAALLALTFRRQRLSAGLAALALLLALATLAQYAVGVDLGIDELFLRAYITVKTADPGRMSPMTALSFALAAAGLLLSVAPTAYRGATVAALASLVAGLGLANFAGYWGGAKTPFEWVDVTYMAVHTSVGFIFLGVGLGAAAWQADVAWRKSTPPWLAGPAAVLLATLTVVLWQSLLADERYRLRASVAQESEALRREITRRIEPDTRALARMADRWVQRGGTPREEWEADAASYVRDLAGLRAVLWVDPEYRLQWIVPEPETGFEPGLVLGQNPAVQAALDRFRERRAPTITRTLAPQRPTFITVVPLYSGDDFGGFIAGTVELAGLLSEIVRGATEAGFDFAVIEGEERVFASAEEPPNSATTVPLETEVRVLDVDWTLRVWPNQERIAASHTALPVISLIAGLMLSSLAFSTVALGQLAVARARETQRVNEELVDEVEERKRAEAELQELTRTLEKKVAERTREIEASRANALQRMDEARSARHAAEAAERSLAEHNELLAQANEDLKQFAYVASHDLQEPLRMVASYVQLLEQRYADKLDDDARDFIAFAVDGAMRMKQLINDLLQYSRVETRGTNFAATDLEEVLSDVLDNLQVAIGESGAAVTHDALPTVNGDATQLSMLLQNLIANAIKFRATGRRPEVRITVEPEGEMWRFGVHDNGIGIDPEYAERVFVIFQRLHTRAEYPGTGIGLAVCQRIARRHGGTIWVEPRHSEGATFFFTLPRTQEAGAVYEHG